MTNTTQRSAKTALNIFPDTRFDVVQFDMGDALIESTAAFERSCLTWPKKKVSVSTNFPQWTRTTQRELVASAAPLQRVTASLRRITFLKESHIAGVVILPDVQALLGSLPTKKWAIVISSRWELAYIRLAAAGVHAPTVVVAI